MHHKLVLLKQLIYALKGLNIVPLELFPLETFKYKKLHEWLNDFRVISMASGPALLNGHLVPC